jgi:hypothetical protein
MLNYNCESKGVTMSKQRNNGKRKKRKVTVKTQGGGPAMATKPKDETESNPPAEEVSAETKSSLARCIFAGFIR